MILIQVSLFASSFFEILYIGSLCPAQETPQMSDNQLLRFEHKGCAMEKVCISSRDYASHTKHCTTTSSHTKHCTTTSSHTEHCTTTSSPVRKPILSSAFIHHPVPLSIFLPLSMYIFLRNPACSLTLCPYLMHLVPSPVPRRTCEMAGRARSLSCIHHVNTRTTARLASPPTLGPPKSPQQESPLRSVLLPLLSPPLPHQAGKQQTCRSKSLQSDRSAAMHPANPSVAARGEASPAGRVHECRVYAQRVAARQ